MVAAVRTRRLVCTIIRVADDSQAAPSRTARRPSELLPWADPYIAGLVRRLQNEVRSERAALAPPASRRPRATDAWAFDHRGASRPATAPTADLEPPSPAIEPDWDWWDRPQDYPTVEGWG